MKRKNLSKRKIAGNSSIKGGNEKLTARESKIKETNLLASEKTLAKDWLTEREDRAWNNL